MEKILINEKELFPRSLSLGFLELSTDEQLAKKIFEATGDKVFKGFLPMTWNTAYIVKLRDAKDRLQKSGKYTLDQMNWQNPSISRKATEYFMNNVEKIKGFMPENFNLSDTWKGMQPLFWIAGIGAAAFLFSQIAPFIPKPKAKP